MPGAASRRPVAHHRRERTGEDARPRTASGSGPADTRPRTASGAERAQPYNPARPGERP
ncbi:hypothetical protein ACFQX6_41705 [Streptosporangium lutulentum]